MKVTKAIALKAARELIAGETRTAHRIVEAHPMGGVQSWAGVFRKLIAQAEAIESGTLERASFSIFARGNSKLPFWSFSSMAILDCPGRGECAAWCYSLKSWRKMVKLDLIKRRHSMGSSVGRQKWIHKTSDKHVVFNVM